MRGAGALIREDGAAFALCIQCKTRAMTSGQGVSQPTLQNKDEKYGLR